MSSGERKISQTLVNCASSLILVKDDLRDSKLTDTVFDEFFAGCSTHRFVGVAPIYNERRGLWGLAFAVSEQVLIIHLRPPKSNNEDTKSGRSLLQSRVLCDPLVTLLAFDMNKIALALFNDHGVRILNGVDLQSACGSSDRGVLPTIKQAAGDRIRLHEENILAVFQAEVFDARRTTAFAQQAWAAHLLSTFDGMEDLLRNAKTINTKDMGEMHINLLKQLERGEDRLALSQPTRVVHDYTTIGTDGTFVRIRGDRYQNHIRTSRGTTSQRVTMVDEKTGIEFTTHASVTAAQGRNASVNTNVGLQGRIIKEIVTDGRDGPTNADRARELAVLEALQGNKDLFENPFLKYIFDPSAEVSWPETFPVIDSPPTIITKRELNDSQRRAVEHMLTSTNDTRLTIIQGPPGTGKTTVIAAFVCSAVMAGADGIWLVAQSNVAVKNIAEKLLDVGFTSWRLLVSNDFFDDWHAHLYRKITRYIIRSGEFRQASSRIQGIPVFLCTLSMLSNPRLHIFTKVNPVKTLVIDEASQITLGSYVAPLQDFPSIHKICMIGDDKQLPPYGAEDDSENIKSIFEIEHLQHARLFLSTQYRMPALIGDVVSDVVYDGQLQSNPYHVIPPSAACCWFVHVDSSQERRSGNSWHNPVERATVLKIAEKLQSEGEEYCIITPYDAQRTFLENEMKESGLAWEDKCFNVDSFQGNERDYIIVSVVRTRGLGFLDDLRRSNVMLTRCKKGMYIVTEWDFVCNTASGTLVGRMAAAWQDMVEEIWLNPEHLSAPAQATAA